MSAEGIQTRLLILSDTHGDPLLPSTSRFPEAVDVAIHCGDLTQDSLLSEFQTTIQILKDTGARLKLAIAGNHDSSLDIPFFRRKIEAAKTASQGKTSDDVLKRGHGKEGDARKLFEDARNDNIFFLDEGTHHFTLDNGARIKVYASSYTAGWPGYEDVWGFAYSGSDHRFDISEGTDIVITHGPPHGIFDVTPPPEERQAGCPALFAAVAKAKPKVHCFGHIHSGWGAKLATWRQQLSETPSYLGDIDHERSTTIATLASLGDDHLSAAHFSTSHCASDSRPLGLGQTLFVNAAIMGEEGKHEHIPWLVDIELPRDQGPSWTGLHTGLAF